MVLENELSQNSGCTVDSPVNNDQDNFVLKRFKRIIPYCLRMLGVLFTIQLTVIMKISFWEGQDLTLLSQNTGCTVDNPVNNDHDPFVLGGLRS